MKHIVYFFGALLGIIMFFSSCKTAELIYISDAERDSAQVIMTTYNTTIHPGDELYIYVYSLIPAIAAPFNQDARTLAMPSSLQNLKSSGQKTLQVSETYRDSYSTDMVGYKVDEDGKIIFPILGKIDVAGLTKDSVERVIENKLKDGEYIRDAVVTVSSVNFRVSVMGEVARPKELHVKGERLTILEALAMCGDVTMYGMRDKVVVMRDVKGKIIPMEVDLTKKTLFNSEVYYLQNNDIVYVQPNRLRQRQYRYYGHNAPEYLAITIQVVGILRVLLKTYSRIDRS